MSFPPHVAPSKVLLVPLQNKKELTAICGDIAKALRKEQIPFKIDDSSVSIGKRYSRNDELGTPFGVTIDFQTVEDGTITLRERDSTVQVRGTVEQILKTIKEIVYEGAAWADATKDLETVTAAEEEKSRKLLWRRS